MFGFREAHGMQHTKLLALCQKSLEKGGFICSNVMDSWKADDFPPHQFLLVKIQAYLLKTVSSYF